LNDLDVLESELQKFRIDLPAEKILTLAAYCSELRRWNTRLNLTALTGRELLRRLVVEPVWIGRELKMGGILVDVGSGNGSPALPLQITCQFSVCHLIEARLKRAAFLRHVAAALKLSSTTVHHANFEEMAPSLGRTDWFTLQGLALTEKLLRSIRKIQPPITVVWISSSRKSSFLEPVRSFQVPFSATRVSLFKLDQS